MNVQNNIHDSNTEIKELEIVGEYDTGIAVSSFVTCGISIEVADENEYAVATAIDRERAKKAYPAPRRAEPIPMGEELDIV